MSLFVLAYEVYISADIGQSLKILLRFTYFECGYLKEQILPYHMGAVTQHPWVRANRSLIGLGCSFKIGQLKLFYFVNLKRTTPLQHNREILSNQDSLRRFDADALAVCRALRALPV